MIAIIYAAGYGHPAHMLIILLAGTIGNLADSILGAALERKGRITNDLVNGLNTLIATITALICYWL